MDGNLHLILFLQTCNMKDIAVIKTILIAYYLVGIWGAKRCARKHMSEITNPDTKKLLHFWTLRSDKKVCKSMESLHAMMVKKGII